jgi:hypothetical protein
MASREITGFLDLDQITPVIDALFGAFNLGETCSTAFDKFYVVRIAESNYPQWNGVRKSLVALAAQLGLVLPDQADGPSMQTVLRILAAHFGADQDEDLKNLIEHHSFEYKAGLEALYLIATCFDDGHNLTSFAFEVGWQGGMTSLSGGCARACYLSREVRLFDNTSQITMLGRVLHQAILNANVEKIATLMLKGIAALLSSIRNEALRRCVQRCIAERLMPRPD